MFRVEKDVYNVDKSKTKQMNFLRCIVLTTIDVQLVTLVKLTNWVVTMEWIIGYLINNDGGVYFSS